MLSYSSISCDFIISESIEISFEDNNTFVIYTNFEKEKRKYLLTHNIKNELILFEKKMRLMNKPNLGCTATDIYEVVAGKNKYKIKDTSCLWNGYYYLKKHLGFI
jgi:hypothetical protein